MIKRFQIEDLIVQDSSGVVFRALDTHTGKMVAVRRFFPFGVDGGGLHAEEQAAYNIALNRLSGLNHPALRSVVCGGCDPVDGMPYIATEWIDGEPLAPLIADQAVSSDSAVLLITQALEVSELLSHVLAEEAVWVETELNTIVVGNPESGRGFTFWISPLKWLGGRGENRGLESIVDLTEEVMGWKGCVVNDQAGRGLGGWLKWLRGASATTSLHEARETLAASVGADPPAPATNLVARATTVPLVRSSKSNASRSPLFAALAAIITVASIGVWIWKRKQAIETGAFLPVSPAVAVEAAPPPRGKPIPPRPEPKPAPAAPVPTPSVPPAPAVDPDVERVNKFAAELRAQVDGAEQNAAATLARQSAAVEKQGGIFSPDHCELLVQQKGRVVAVEGVFEKVEFSGTRKTMYLLFEGDTGWNSARGSILLSKAPDLNEAALQPLIGKKIRIKGPVEVQKGDGRERPMLEIKNPAAIEAQP